MTCALFEWDIELPERAASPSWAGPRKAVLSFRHDGEAESWNVPMSVGRKLRGLKRQETFEPASRAELAHMVKELSLSCGTARIEALLNKRDYSSKELRDKLRRDGYGAEISSELVERALRGNLVNDQRFASVYARSKCFSGWGLRKIERELSRRGIDCDSLPGWPEEYLTEDSEFDRALELARRRRLTGKSDFQKIARFLCGKGYSMNVAFDVAKTVLEEREADDESV